MKKLLQTSLAPVLIILFFIATHLWRLTALPIFADEAIYIHWAQLIMDDAPRFLFFPMNDGKTPLFIWSLIPFQTLFADKLLAGRMVSVIVGVGQLLVIQALIRALGGRKKAQWVGMLLVTVLPFWFFHHRMALMDAMLTLWISVTALGLIHLIKLPVTTTKKQKFSWPIIVSSSVTFFFQPQTLFWTVFTGIAFGLALWTKLPAIFALLIWPLFLCIKERKTLLEHVPFFAPFGASALIGLLLFLVLRVSPMFGQLFSRSQDFTYPISEVLAGKWRETLPHFFTYVGFFLQYLLWPTILLSVAGIFSNTSRRQNIILLLSAFAFATPFIVLGKTVYPRYLFPVSLFLTVSAVLSLQSLYDRYFLRSKVLWKKLLTALMLALLAAQIVTGSAQFMIAAWNNPDNLPFNRLDREQYLEEWSSGHGIKEAVEYIRTQAQDHSIAVATEGSFGTLPDALTVYFHGSDLKNIYIEGTAQYPVKTIPPFFVKRALMYKQSILVVNSHRREIELPQNQLIAEYCRPNHAPCLQIWDITAQVQANSKLYAEAR